tara:strand:- start:2647 stop:2853 length:207 start_codon:yes stop_codon:yes gene_type:complete
MKNNYMKYYKVSEGIYIVIAAVSLFEIINLWNINREKSYFFCGFAFLSISMFFFRRYYRIKFNKRAKK